MLSVDKKVLQNLLFPKKNCKFTEYFLAEASMQRTCALANNCPLDVC